MKSQPTVSEPRSGSGLTKKATLNAVASALDYGARLAVGFLINPLLVGGLGDYAYGVWQVLGRLIGYISPASGRPTQALKWTIAKAQASSDYEEKRLQVGMAVAVALLFLPLLIVLGGLLSWFAPYWLRAPAELVWTVRLAAGMLVLNVILLSLVELPRSVLTGENLGYKRMGLSATLVCVGGGLTALAVYLETGLAGVATATVITSFLTGILFLQVTRTYVPWFGISRPSLGSVGRFASLSGWFLAANVNVRLMRASDVVILGIFGSAELVTTYSLTKYVPETIVNFVAIVVFAITPGLGGLIGKREFEKAVRVRGEIMLFTWLLLTIGGSAVLLWTRSFVQLWVGPNYYTGPLPLLLIVVMIGQFVLIRNDSNIIDLNLDLRRKVLIGLFSTAVSLLIASLLVGFFDLQVIGICVGFLLGRLVLSFAYPWLTGQLLDIPMRSQVKSLIRPVLVMTLMFAAATGLSPQLTATTWPALVASVGTTLAVVSPLAILLGTSRQQRGWMRQRVHGMTRRGKAA